MTFPFNMAICHGYVLRVSRDLHPNEKCMHLNLTPLMAFCCFLPGRKSPPAFGRLHRADFSIGLQQAGHVLNVLLHHWRRC